LPHNALSPWLPLSQTGSDVRLRLFCFPYAGRGASVYSGWREQVPPSIQLCPVQLPGREDRLGESPFESLEPLLVELLKNLRAYLDVPFAFFGHSLGALLSFELARLVRREQRPLVHVFLSGRAAPGFDHSARGRHMLSDDELLYELKGMNGTSGALLSNLELMRLMLPTIRADFAICERAVHRPEPPLACPITVFGGMHDPEANEGDLKPWGRETSNLFTLHMYAGDHFFLHSCQKLVLGDLIRHLQPL
jgi:medium-chain acyl-[acyl-carrier-protein] hydrolase